MDAALYVNLPLVSAVRMTSGRVALGFLADEHQPAMQHCGMEVSPGYIIVNNFDVVHQRFGSDIRYGSMSLTRGELNSGCKALTGREFPGDKRVIGRTPNSCHGSKFCTRPLDSSQKLLLKFCNCLNPRGHSNSSWSI